MKYNFANHEYQNFTEFVMCFVLSSGKFSEKDYIRFSGFGGQAARIRVKQFNGKSEFNKAKQQQYISPSGANWDTFVKEYNDSDTCPGTIDEMHGINEICEILQLSRNEMKTRLQFANIGCEDLQKNYWAGYNNFFENCNTPDQLKAAYKNHYAAHGKNATIMQQINEQLAQLLYPELYSVPF